MSARSGRQFRSSTGTSIIAWDRTGRETCRSPATIVGSYNAGIRGGARLQELVRTNDVVLLSAIGALLDGAEIDYLVMDQNISVLEGSVGIIPRRVLVHSDDVRAARQVLTDAGLAHELRGDA